MAKKSSSTAFREIIEDIRKGIYAPIYLLSGEEDYYIDKISEALESSVVPEDEKDFNATIYYGADVNIRQVISRAQQFPLMSERQLVMLKEAQAMEKAKSQLELLESYAGHINETTVLVVTFKGESIAGTSKMVKGVQKAGGVVFKSERIRDWDIQGALSDYCREKRVKIDNNSMQLLLEYIGSPLSKLFGEVDKLVVAAGPSGEITPQLIEEVIGISKEFNVFELIKKISMRDYVNSMRIVDHFSRNPKQNPGVVIGATLFNYFSKLFMASILKDKSDSSIMNELDLKTSYSLPDYRNGIRNYKAGTIDSIIHAIRDYDVMSKGVESTQNEYALLKELIFKIFTLN